jgi:hypothetical protein
MLVENPESSIENQEFLFIVWRLDGDASLLAEISCRIRQTETLAGPLIFAALKVTSADRLDLFEHRFRKNAIHAALVLDQSPKRRYDELLAGINLIG